MAGSETIVPPSGAASAPGRDQPAPSAATTSTYGVSAPYASSASLRAMPNPERSFSFYQCYMTDRNFRYVGNAVVYPVRHESYFYS